jgi:excisionase family DNA binding protein
MARDPPGSTRHPLRLSVSVGRLSLVTTTTDPAASPVPCPGQLPLFDVPDRARLRSVREAARLLHVSRDVLYDAIRAGVLPATRPGGHLRVALSDLEDYVRSTAVTATANDAGPATVPAGPAGKDDL